MGLKEILKAAEDLSVDERKELISELRDQLLEDEDRFLRSLSPEVPGQINGHWIAPDQALPILEPPYRPTGAILPRPPADVTAPFDALDLVFVERLWLVLSEAGRYTYAHSSGLLHGERWKLISWSPRRVFAVEYGPLLSLDELRTAYGDEVAQRCRPDRRLVQLRVSPLAG